MIHDIQKADIWKRIAAWVFDWILLSVLIVGLGVFLSWILGYDTYSTAVEQSYSKYELQYGVVFEITQDEYMSMSEAAQKNYDAAYAALTSDTEAMYAYNMMLNLTLVITTGAIAFALLLWEFLIPLYLGNGQTVGKKIFGLCLVRTDGVKLNTMQLFTRTLLGKFTVETMIPVYILLMLFWGLTDLTGTLILLALLIAQVICIIVTRTNSAIHDLLAGTVVVDLASQTIFRTTEDLIAYQKKTAAEQAARQSY